MFLAENLSFFERLGLGGMTAFVGIAMVFLVLALLIGVINLMRIVVKNLPTFMQSVKTMFAKLFKSNEKKNNNSATPSKKEDIVVTNSTISNENNENNEELVACITGAISYIFATEQNIPTNQARAKFVVKSIKRI